VNLIIFRTDSFEDEYTVCFSQAFPENREYISTENVGTAGNKCKKCSLYISET
jgi:hypothetical protein